MSLERKLVEKTKCLMGEDNQNNYLVASDLRGCRHVIQMVHNPEDYRMWIWIRAEGQKSPTNLENPPEEIVFAISRPGQTLFLLERVGYEGLVKQGQEFKFLSDLLNSKDISVQPKNKVRYYHLK